MSCQCGSITRTRISRGSSITPIICASWSAASTNYLRLLGIDRRGLIEEAQAPDAGFVVRSMQVEFIKPACMDDLLEVLTEPKEVKGASVVLHQKIMRGEELLIDAQVRLAFVAGGRVRPIPKSVRAAMEAHHQRP